MDTNCFVRPSGHQVKLSPKPRAARLQPRLKLPKKPLQPTRRRLPIKHVLEIWQLRWSKNLLDCLGGCELGLDSDSPNVWWWTILVCETDHGPGTFPAFD
jgi:hypothetical protein